MYRTNCQVKLQILWITECVHVPSSKIASVILDQPGPPYEGCKQTKEHVKLSTNSSSSVRRNLRRILSRPNWILHLRIEV
jgi:hypothetical protein